MSLLIYDVILDVGTTGCQQTVSLYQGDDRAKMLRITLLQNGRQFVVPSDMNVRLHGVKPDDSLISPKCGVRGGSIYYLPAAHVTGTQGTVLCQLLIRDHSGAILFTPEFSMEIVASLPIPELPEGAAEEMEYNAEVLSELTASADGGTLLFRGEPVGIRISSVLPETADEDTIVYLDGNGFYRYTDNAWMRLTDDETVTAVTALRQESHTHANQSVLDNLTVQNNELLYNGNRIGISMVTSLPHDVDYGTILYRKNDGFWFNNGSYGAPVWTQLTHDGDAFSVMYLMSVAHSHENKAVLDVVTSAKIADWDGAVTNRHTHANKAALDRITGTADDAFYNGRKIPLVQPEDVTLLSFTEYDGLSVRDEAISGESLADVPVYLTGGVGNICVLSEYANDTDGDSIALYEARQYGTRVPERILKATVGGTPYYYCPVDHYDDLGTLTHPQGWSDTNGQSVSAPSFSGFTPNSFKVGTDRYLSLSNLPADAQSALASLSQCVNVSAAAMGHIVIPEDAVERFAGELKPNHKYMFQTGTNFTLTLPAVPFGTQDAQFVLYLTCTADIDVTFPSGTVFAGGAPNTDTGSRKIIGCWLRDLGKWAVGCVDYEAVS